LNTLKRVFAPIQGIHSGEAISMLQKKAGIVLAEAVAMLFPLA
jgi:hypothetical protein